MSEFLLLAILLAGALSLHRLLGPQKTQKPYRPPLPPGPRGFPIVGSIPLLGPNPHRSLLALSDRYGPLMHLRIGSVPTIVVSDAPTAQQFLKTHDVAFASRPPSEIFACISYGLRGFAFAEHGDYWRRIRKLCVTHLLSAPKIASFRSARRQEIEAYLKALTHAAEAGEKVDVSAGLGELVADIVCRMIMGRKFAAGDGDGKKFRENTKELMGLMGEFNVNDFIPAIGVLDVQRIRRRMRRVHEELDEILERIVDEHLEARARAGEGEEERERDFVDVMLDLMERDHEEEEVDGVKFDRTTVKAIVLDMLEASMDTMRTPIEWALSELLRHPRIMKKAQQQLDTVVGLGRLVEESDLPKLEYLGLIVKETLRLHPLSAFLFHYGKQECEVEGFRIPKGSTVIISLWALGRDPTVWGPDVEEFRPERLVDSNVDFRGNDFRLLSFGAGRRMCAGSLLALIVYPLILAQLVRCFDWELPDRVPASELDMKEAFGFTMPRAEHLWAVPSKRIQISDLVT